LRETFWLRPSALVMSSAPLPRPFSRLKP
jgi:hypothetical protein